MIQVIIHEVAHSLDLHGAYKDKPLSGSDRMWKAYNADPNTPNEYSKTAMVENVAEQTMIAVFNEIVPGGFGTIEPEWKKISNQYHFVQEEGKLAGKGNSIFRPGSSEKCTHKVPSTKPVNMNANSKFRLKRLVSARNKPDITLRRDIIPIEVRAEGEHTNCAHREGDVHM